MRWWRFSGPLLTRITGRIFIKLVRFGAPGREKPGMLDAQGRIRDLSKVIPDIAGDVLSPKGLAKLRKVDVDKLPLVRGTPRIGPCVGKVGNFRLLGHRHAGFSGVVGIVKPNGDAIIFNKAPTCICGPNDDTMIPKQSAKLAQARRRLCWQACSAAAAADAS
jgi:hypothetical protein